MRTYVERPKATQPIKSGKVPSVSRAELEQGNDPNSLLYLQRTIGNQAVLRLLQSNTEEGNAVLGGTAAPHFGHDFSRIPVSPPKAGALQTKLAINTPGDEYEQEADRVAEQVMCMPESQMQRACACSGECPSCQRERPGQEPERLQTKRAQASDAGQMVAPSIAHEVIAAPGQPLDSATRAFFEPRFGHDFSRVRVHTSSAAEQSVLDVNANAYTVGPHIAFAPGSYRPGTEEGTRLMAHEFVHVVQQGAAPPLLRTPVSVVSPVAAAVVHRSVPRVARDTTTVEVELVSSRDDYQPPGSRERYRVGDAAASRVLLDIQELGARVTCKVFNFETGAAEEMSPAEWSFFRGAAIIGGSNAAITRLGRQLSPSQWRSLWPNPMPQILRMFESGQLNLEDEALLSGYRGMIRSDAARSLDENERAIDEILGATDRVNRIRDFATGLREASLVRDALVQRRDELSRRLVAQHSFTFGLPHAGTGPNVVQQLNIQPEREEVERALSFWLSAFPLLTRLQTQQISAEAVEARLSEIKTNIISTREQLNRGRLDPMTLDTVRARLAGRLGPRATAVVEAEDRSRARWTIAGAVGMTVAAIGILFLPGGVFIDAAIGVAIAGHAVANAVELGRAANTGLHVDEGLVSQSQAQGARFAAVLATVFAVVGAASAGFRVLRVGLALRGLGRSMPELALAERGAVTRAIADDPALLSAFTRMAPGDAAVSARVAAAVRQAGGDVRALRAALADVARIAAIPRRVPTGPDLYEPLRRIADGSDLERIATQTGLTRAEVEAAKRNLMFDEHILVDDVTGALYRGRFTPFDRVADVWGRAARGEVAEVDRQFLRQLVRHEQVEGALLSSSGRTLEQAFLRGELEGQLRRFLQSHGWNQARIERMLASEPRPMTPYRYAHLVTALSGAPNP